MKIKSIVALTLVLILALSTLVFANPVQSQLPQRIEGDNIYMPLRLAAYAHGASVEWDAENWAVLVTAANGDEFIVIVEEVGGFIEDGTSWVPYTFISLTFAVTQDEELAYIPDSIAYNYDEVEEYPVENGEVYPAEDEDAAEESDEIAPMLFFSGTFVEYACDESAVEFFEDGTFIISIPLSYIDLDMPGSFSIAGTYTIDYANQLIIGNIDEENILDFMTGIIDLVIDYMIATELAEFGSLAQDEAFIDTFMDIMLMMMDSMLDELMEEIMAEIFDEFDNMVLRFDGNFDRLYDDEHNAIFTRRELAPTRPIWEPVAPELLDMDLVGTWNWMGTPYYVFNADGSGERIIFNETNPITWTVNDGIIIICTTPDRCGASCRAPEEWIYEVDGDSMVLTSNQVPGMRFTYTRG